MSYPIHGSMPMMATHGVGHLHNSYEQQAMMAHKRSYADVPDTFSHLAAPVQGFQTNMGDLSISRTFMPNGFGSIREEGDNNMANIDERRGSDTSGPLCSSDDDDVARGSMQHGSTGLASATNTATAAASSGASKKRSRATPEQLAILEETFLTNTSPNAKLREILSRQVNMTERSIQIWFQNRRAKVKLMQKRAAQQAAQEQAMRAQSYLAAAYGMRSGFYPAFGMQFAPYPQMPPKMPLGRSNSVDYSMMGMNMGMNMPMDATMGNMNAMGLPMNLPPAAMPAGQPSQLPALGNGMPSPKMGNGSLSMTFTSESLCIGTWRRVPITTNDLVCSFNTAERIMRWQIVEGSSKFKMEFPFTSIVGISFEQVDAFTGQMVLDLSQPPTFFMEMNVNGSIMWTQCRDFTENTQATTVLRHIIRGQLQSLRNELLMICQADASIHRVTQFNSNPAGSPTSRTDGTSTSMAMPSFVRRHSTPNLMVNNAMHRRDSLKETLLRRPKMPPAVVTSIPTGSATFTDMSNSLTSNLPTDPSVMGGSAHVGVQLITPPLTPPPALAVQRRHSIVQAPLGNNHGASPSEMSNLGNLQNMSSNLLSSSPSRQSPTAQDSQQKTQDQLQATVPEFEASNLLMDGNDFNGTPSASLTTPLSISMSMVNLNGNATPNSETAPSDPTTSTSADQFGFAFNGTEFLDTMNGSDSGRGSLVTV